MLFITVYFLFSCHPEKVLPEEKVAQNIVLQIDSFSDFIEKKLLPVVESNVDGKQLQQLFLKSRLAYKKFEWAAEYFTITVTRTVNGPPVPEVELNGQIRQPGGLQVIETLLYPCYEPKNKQQLIAQLRHLQAECAIYKLYFKNIALFRWQVWEAAKQELFRIQTLGITGFDDPLSGNSMAEAATSLQSLRQMLTNYARPDSRLPGLLRAAAYYLNVHQDFNTFDRAEFIIKYANPVTRVLTQIQQKPDFHPLHYKRLLVQDAATLFDASAFDSTAFASDPGETLTPEKIAIGRQLFNDPLLSGTMTRSCASCHKPEKGFTDGLARHTVFNSKSLLDRHTPALLNAALQPAQFADLRANTLEEQVGDVLANQKEMHSSIQLVRKRLTATAQYPQLFAAAFHHQKKDFIKNSEIIQVISSYVRSLSSLNSRFDQYMRGDSFAMTSDEISGFNLFMGRARCGTCHYMPLFNGALPPFYETMDAEIIGVPKTRQNKAIDPDEGRYKIIPVDPLKYAFKTPTIRNSARTAPYMHNGVFQNLKQVIDFYNKGGGAGLGLKIPNQTLSSEPLKLSSKEEQQLIVFIHSLDN